MYTDRIAACKTNGLPVSRLEPTYRALISLGLDATMQSPLPIEVIRVGRNEETGEAVYEDLPQPQPFTRPPTNYEQVYREGYTPLERLRIRDEDRFEVYVHEWLFTLPCHQSCG